MTYKKLLYMRSEQKEALDEIQREIESKGGYVTLMSLIDDSIQIFIDYYKDEAIRQHSPRRYGRISNRSWNNEDRNM